MLECLVLIAEVCFLSLDQQVSVDSSSLGNSAIVRTATYKATLDWNSDAIRTPDWSRMNSACWQGVCVAYYKHCAVQEHKYVCSYHFSQPGDMANKELRIEADSRKGIEAAEEQIAVLARTGFQFSTISLNRFTIESSGSEPPYCRRSAESSCWPQARTSP